MKIAHVSVLLDFKQVMVMRWLVQEALRAMDEDLELVEKLHSASARSIARVSISDKRDTCQELAQIAREAREKLYDGEYDGEYDDEYDDEHDADGIE